MEFFAESTVKGRKEHCCDACRKPIEVGIVHSYMRMKYDGDFSAVRNHMECREAECDLAKQAGVWGPEDWLFLHDLEREDAEWVKAKHPIAWSRIADRYAYLDEEDQPMTNEPEPNTRPLPQPSELVERLLTVGDDHAVLMESRDFDYCAGCPTDGCHCKRAVAETLAVYSQAAAQIAKLQIFADEQFKVDSEIQAHQQQQLAKLQADGDKLAGALEMIAAGHGCPSALATATLTEWKDRA